ncbi:MAG: helicase-associated domain-containing protein [Acidimicrobiales bacterium]
MNFLDHLWSWSAEELSHLMQSRPDLLPASDRGLEAVARKAGTAMSLGRLLVSADVGMLVVAEALVAKDPATVDEIDKLLGTNDPTAVIDAVERLRRNGVVVINRGVISPVGSLRDLLHRPLGLGPSFAELAEHLPTETIDRLAERTRAAGSTKHSSTVRAIADRLAQPEVVDSLLADAPPESRELFATLVSHRSPAVPLPTGYPYRGLDADDPLAWLVETGLVIAVSESGAELPRELVIAALAEGLAPSAVLRAVPLQPVAGLGADVVAGAAADSANRLLDGAEILLRLVGQGEVSVRKTGGIGPREIKRLAKVCGVEAIDIARLFELLNIARLLTLSGGSIAQSGLAGRWWTMSRDRRYLALARAWLSSDRFLSRGLATADEDKVAALGEGEPVAAVGAARAVTLATICELPPTEAFQPDQLTETVVWKGPNLWGAGEPPPEVLVGWTLAECEFLGLISNNAASDIGRALAATDEADLERATTAALAEDQDQVVLQNDLTAVSFGPLAPIVARSLGEMTERTGGVGDGLAPAFRFTETSLRRAFDRGWNTESITGFLNQHALAGVPQPLEYLVADVARRYGSIRVMPAQSVIVTVDDILAVEIASNRKAASLGLKLIAPTVLTSPLDPVTVVEDLRALGLFPMLEGSTVVIDRSAPAPGAGSGSGSDGAVLDLPADWTGPPVPSGPFADEVSEAVAQLTASEQAAEQTVGDETLQPGGDPRPAADLEEHVTTDRLLQAHWRRAVVIEAIIDGSPQRVSGTLVGLGPVVSILTVDGVVDLPADVVVTVDEPATG